MKINGGEILVFGDLHFSDVFTGKHKNYLENCCTVLRQILDMVNERKPKTVVFLGDIVGWSDVNIKSREVLAMFCDFFSKIRGVAEHIIVVRGNHDMKGYPDFQFLLSLGLVETYPYFDYINDNGEVDVRFHIVNYGEENKPLDILSSTSNVVFAHNNFVIDGVTNWYNEHDGLDLCTLKAFSDVDLVVSGHIHNPSPNIVGVDMPSGRQCLLFYLGCPTRPIKISNNYNACWALAFEYKNGVTDYDTIPMMLQDCSEIYYSDDEFIEDDKEEDLAEQLRKEQLADVLGDIMKYRITGGDLFGQIDSIPNATEEAKNVAKDYLQIAYNNERQVK